MHACLCERLKIFQIPKLPRTLFCFAMKESSFLSRGMRSSSLSLNGITSILVSVFVRCWCLPSASSYSSRGLRDITLFESLLLPLEKLQRKQNLLHEETRHNRGCPFIHRTRVFIQLSAEHGEDFSHSDQLLTSTIRKLSAIFYS